MTHASFTIKHFLHVHTDFTKSHKWATTFLYCHIKNIDFNHLNYEISVAFSYYESPDFGPKFLGYTLAERHLN